MKCFTCGKAEFIHDTREVTHVYRGQALTFMQEADFCPACGECLMNVEQGKAWEEKVFAFQAQVDKEYLPSAEIKRIRKKLHLTQQEASEVFGGGVNAFSKYERGTARQHKSTDVLLRFLERHPEMLPEIVEVAKHDGA